MKKYKMTTMKRLIAVFTAAVMIAVCLPLSSLAATLTDSEQDKIDSYKEQQDALDDDIASAQEKIDSMKGDIEQEEAYIEELTTQINNYQSKIDVLNDSISALETQKTEINNAIDELEGQIETIEKDINHNQIEMLNSQHEIDDIKGELKTSLTKVYMNGNVSELEYLLACSNLSDYLNLLEISSNKAEHDNEIIATINDAVARVEELNVKNNELIEQLNGKIDEKQADIDKLNENETQLNSQKGELEDSQSQVQALEAEHVATLQSLNAESDLYESMITEYEEQQAAIDSQINAVIAAAEKRAAEAAAKAASSGTSTQTTTFGGTFIWPLQYSDAYISSSYGYRTSPSTGSYTLHGGVDTCCYSGTQGKTVVAAAAGTVIYSSWNGYGNCILIDHGSGYYTLYGHLDSRAVSSGQTVAQGQTIGYAGNTYGAGGYSTGPHLHFEIRVNGSKVNPTAYCSP